MEVPQEADGPAPATHLDYDSGMQVEDGPLGTEAMAIQQSGPLTGNDRGVVRPCGPSRQEGPPRTSRPGGR